MQCIKMLNLTLLILDSKTIKKNVYMLLLCFGAEKVNNVKK